VQQDVSIEVQGITLRGTVHMPDERTGDVPAVILFHGFTSHRLEAHRLFVKVSRFLESQGVASFRFDFAGSGESDGSFSEMTVTSELRDASAILDFVKAYPHINASRITLCGLSLGGMVATLLAKDRPHDINQLILIAPAGNFKQIIEEMMQAYHGIEHSEVFDYGGHPVGRSFAEEILQLNPFERAKGFTGQVLLIHGTQDARVPVSVSERYLADTYEGRGRLILVEDANHTFDSLKWEEELIQSIFHFIR
jgi:uncharacterized protein